MAMKALVLHQYNGQLELTEIARPKPQPGQILLRVDACGLNPLDVKIRAGLAPHAKHPLPLVLGMDVAGTVVEVGEGVTSFAPGDEVYGMTGGVGGIQGGLAQYAAVDERLIARKPSNITMREAAAVPLCFVTAYEGIVDRAHLLPQQAVLVHGGAGGVGHMAVQLSIALGAKVFATGAARSAKAIEGYGATAIDYESCSVSQYVDRYTEGQGFDLVVDTVGGATLDASFVAIKRFGHVVSVLGFGTHSLAPLTFNEGTYSGVFTLIPLLTGKGRDHHSKMLNEATRLIEGGQLRPRMDPRRFGFSEVESAYIALSYGSNQGKVVVEIA
jgi:NADPH2:quinone reductase